MITQKTIAEELGISTATLKNWVHALNLTPPRHRSGRAKYDQQFIEVLYKIKDLREKGTGLQTIRELIQEEETLPQPTSNLSVQFQQLKISHELLKQEIKELKQNKIYKLEKQNHKLLEEIIELHRELKNRPSMNIWQSNQDQLQELQSQINQIKNHQQNTISGRIFNWIKKFLP